MTLVRGEKKMSAAPLKVEGSGDWLTDILDAMDGEDIHAMEMAEQLELKDEVLFSLEAQNPGEAGAVDVVDKVGGDAGCDAGSKQRERDTQNSTVVHETRTELNGKLKRSEREKRRRDALNDHFMGLSVLLEPRLTEAVKTDKATILTEAAKVIKALRQQLQVKSDSLNEVTEKNAALTKEWERILQDKHKLEYQLACFPMGSQRRAERPVGCPRHIIDAIPKIEFGGDEWKVQGRGDMEMEECSVCIDSFEPGEVLCSLPACQHVFHEDCIEEWLVQNTTCPNCRESLVQGEGEGGDVESGQREPGGHGRGHGCERGCDLGSRA